MSQKENDQTPVATPPTRNVNAVVLYFLLCAELSLGSFLQADVNRAVVHRNKGLSEKVLAIAQECAYSV